MSGGDLRERATEAAVDCGVLDELAADAEAGRLDHRDMVQDAQRIADAVLAELGLTEDPAEMRRVGDLLQSDASRLAEWVIAQDDHEEPVPYEVHSAAHSAQSAVEKWTALRSGVGS